MARVFSGNSPRAYFEVSEKKALEKVEKHMLEACVAKYTLNSTNEMKKIVQGGILNAIDWPRLKGATGKCRGFGGLW